MKKSLLEQYGHQSVITFEECMEIKKCSYEEQLRQKIKEGKL